MYHYKKPTIKEIPAMQNLVLAEVENGNILVRSEDEMATTIRSYIVVYDNEQLIGFVALHIHSPILCEIRSLVVSQQYRGKGVGSQLIRLAIDEAKEYDLKQILVLTYQQQLFEKFDFAVIDKSSIPDNKIWADCIKCKHFPICDEIALMLNV